MRIKSNEARCTDWLKRPWTRVRSAISTGLIYPPGAWTGKEELVDLVSVVAKKGGLYFSHIRDESDRLMEVDPGGLGDRAPQWRPHADFAFQGSPGGEKLAQIRARPGIDKPCRGKATGGNGYLSVYFRFFFPCHPVADLGAARHGKKTLLARLADPKNQAEDDR